MTGIKICGTGCFLPDNVVTNDQFTAFVETSDEWIRTRTGIISRHIADGDTSWSMGAESARRALEDAKIDASEVDLIIVATLSPDYATPSMSCVIQGVIGATHAMCLDINCACAGFVYALDMARRYLCTGDVQTALVISAETVSRIIDFRDRTSCVLFGDGAGACVIQAADRPFASVMGSDGSGSHLIFCKNAPHETPFTHKPPIDSEIERNPAEPGHFVQDGKEVYKFATKMMPQAIEQACAKAGITPAELAWIIPHQANMRIIQTAMKNLGLPLEKAFVNIEHVANTSSATIPIALDELARSGKLGRGDKICLVGFGAGLVHGATVFEY